MEFSRPLSIRNSAEHALISHLTHTHLFSFFSFTTQSSKKLACCVKCKKKKKTQLNKIIKTDFVSWLVFNPELITSVYFCSRTKKKNNDLNEKCGVFLCCKHLVQRHVSQWCCINSSFNKSVRELRTAALDLKANPFPIFPWCKILAV